MTDSVNGTILIVDDEVNVLKSIMRLLHPLHYRVLMATSGADALELLRNNVIDLVISDMRMPHMDGATLLAHIHAQWPDTVRLLLTGHADQAQTIEAINRGQIYRYIAKPWHDAELLTIVEQGLERRRLEQENRRLLQVTVEQNAALAEANQLLEQKVANRTAELQQLVSFLEVTQSEVKESFKTTVQVLANVLDMRFSDWIGHSQRVSVLAERFALAVQLPEDEIEHLSYAARLHDVGKLALPEGVATKARMSYNRQEINEFIEHPALGQMVLLPISAMNKAGALIRSQHENYDGTGFPQRLHGDAIPLAARILAIAIDYDELQMGLVLPHALSAEQAELYIRENAGKRYDPKLVSLLADAVESANRKLHEKALHSPQLKPGMVLSRDLYSQGRFLLLTRGRQLDNALIEHIRHFERSEGKPITVYILQS